MKKTIVSLFLWVVSVGLCCAMADDYDPDPSRVVKCTEDSFGHVIISWEGPTGPRFFYTVTISGGLIETHYTSELSVKTKSPLPRGQVISIVVGLMKRSIEVGGIENPIDIYENGIYVEHARGSYTYGSTSSGPCPKKIGTATASFYRGKDDNGRWQWSITVDHERDQDTNDAHTSFRVFIHSESLGGNVVGFDYCSGGGSTTISGYDAPQKLYVQMVATDCAGDSPSFEGHYLFGEIDLENISSGEIELSEENR